MTGLVCAAIMYDISTHSLTRRLTVMAISTLLLADISTHSLTRRLTAFLGYQRSRIWHFNSQPHKEADDMLEIPFAIESNFNSQPHKEADAGSLTPTFSFGISTHSLTRRLTPYYKYHLLWECISTHSLTRRLTF